MATFGTQVISGVSKTEFNTEGAVTYTYTVPAGKTAYVTLSGFFTPQLTGTSAYIVVNGSTEFTTTNIADGETINSPLLTAGQTAYIELEAFVAGKGFINAIEYEA